MPDGIELELYLQCISTARLEREILRRAIERGDHALTTMHQNLAIATGKQTRRWAELAKMDLAAKGQIP